MSITNLNKPVAGSTGWATSVNDNFTDVENLAKGTESAEAIAVDNLKLDGNTLSSIDTNGNINITPDGSGKVVLDGLNWPMADGSANQVIETDGSGNLSFVTPGGSSDFAKISTTTASSDATVDITSGIDSTYAMYMIEFIDVVPATDNVYLNLRISTDAGSSWKSGSSDYQWSLWSIRSNGGSDDGRDNSVGQIRMTRDQGGHRWGSASGEGGQGRLLIPNPSGSSLYKAMHWDWSLISHESSAVGGFGSGAYKGGTTAINGIRFYFSSGNIESGEFVLWGRKN